MEDNRKSVIEALLLASEKPLPLDKIREVNVEGTRRVLDLALGCPRLKKVDHLSTAYICGDYKGLFRETDLDVGQKFSTTYEQSKFEAEKLVEEYRKKGIWIDIFRSVLIIGDSKTGKTPQFKHTYQFLQIAASGLFESLPLENAKLNFVTVDFVAQFIYKISNNTKRRNQNYHAFPSESSFLIEDVLNVAAKCADFKAPKVVNSADFDFKSLSAVQQIILKNNFLAVNSSANFTGLARTVIVEYGLPIAEFACFEKMILYAKQQGYLRVNK